MGTQGGGDGLWGRHRDAAGTENGASVEPGCGGLWGDGTEMGDVGVRWGRGVLGDRSGDGMWGYIGTKGRGGGPWGGGSTSGAECQHLLHRSSSTSRRSATTSSNFNKKENKWGHEKSTILSVS